MRYKNLLIYCNIFLLTLTIGFSNIYTNFVMAETAAEAATETTTEAPSVINNYCEPAKQLDIKARSVILIDADTGIILYEKNADEVLYPASITKILTALLGCEYGHFDETVKHSENAINGIGYGSSTMGMKIGEEISLENCLYGIMMCSANEACMALAEHISGNVDSFVEKMNERALALGCKNTHFANPHGFHDPNHYTTARDMSLITREAVKNQEFSKIWGTMLYTLPPTNLVDEQRGLVNRAKILDDESQYYYPYIKGAKTGFHDEAQNTLVTCGEKNGVKLICVVMKNNGAALCYNDAKTLMEYGFSQYSEKTIYSGKDYTSPVNVVQTYKGKKYPLGSVLAVVKGDGKKLVPSSFDITNLKAEPILEKDLEAPVMVGDVIGKMELTYDNTKFGELDIVASTAVNRLSDSQMSKKELIINIKHMAGIMLKYVIIPVGFVILLIAILRVIKAILIAILKPKRKKRHRKGKKRKYKQQSSKNTRRKKRKRPVSSDKKPVRRNPNKL